MQIDEIKALYLATEEIGRKKDNSLNKDFPLIANWLMIRKLKIEVNTMENIIISPTNKIYDSVYMKRNDK